MGNTGWLGMKEAAGSRGPGGGGRWMLDAERGITTMDDGEKGGCWQVRRYATVRRSWTDVSI